MMLQRLFPVRLDNEGWLLALLVVGLVLSLWSRPQLSTPSDLSDVRPK